MIRLARDAAYAGRVAGRYRSTREAVILERQHVERALVAALGCLGWHDLDRCRILDIGSGDGGLLIRLMSLGARARNLAGVDLLAGRLRDGEDRCPALSLALADGGALPFADASFDVTLAYTMFSSVLEEEKRSAIAGEIRRVTRGGGCSIWYDMRVTRPDNPAVRSIGLREARRFYPDCDVKSRIVSLNPLLARRIAHLSWTVADLLSSVPFLCGHRLTVIRFPAGDS